MPGTGGFKLTGQLGEVITESANLALAWVKSHSYELGISPSRTEDIFKHIDIHIHLPSGSVKKDGPSAGVAMVCALVSLLRDMPILGRLAMTGEITLRGNVTPVGGIKEKVSPQSFHPSSLILTGRLRRSWEHTDQESEPSSSPLRTRRTSTPTCPRRSSQTSRSSSCAPSGRRSTARSDPGSWLASEGGGRGASCSRVTCKRALTRSIVFQYTWIVIHRSSFPFAVNIERGRRSRGSRWIGLVRGRAGAALAGCGTSSSCSESTLPWSLVLIVSLTRARSRFIRTSASNPERPHLSLPPPSTLLPPSSHHPSQPPTTAYQQPCPDSK
jgi:hypothetical protein